MFNQRLVRWIKNFRSFLFICLSLFPLTLHASFIEATIGTAVVNDATATYYNPAGLTLVSKPQIIGLGSIAYSRTQFTGQAVQPATGFTLSGTSITQTHYYLPSFYLGIPISDKDNKVVIGLAVLSNDFSNELQENSILRYAQANNHIESVDLVPALGIKLNDYFALGAGLDFTYAKFVLRPTIGFPSLNIPDSQSLNESNAKSWGGDVGFLLKPTKSTLIGFNYRSAITYRQSGKSIFEGNPTVTSNHYHFKIWTPASSVITISQSVTKNLGFISTIRHIEWSVLKDINIFEIATPLGILPEASVHFHLHNTWLLTLGGYNRFTPKWIIRIAATYSQSPANGNFQISNGDSIILGGSTGYEINKHVTIDVSYAHVFIKNETIHITSKNIIDGVNKGFRDAASLKLTFNL